MKQTVSDRLRPLLLTATLFLSLTAAAQTTTSVEIKSVDNYAGNSNVTTNAPNTTVTVTELDADKKPVRSWTGTTDADGKITIPAGSNLSKPYLRAKSADPKMAEFVLPPDLRTNEPFMFAATGVVEGEVISVQTVEGEVVATKKADKFGRVFLAAGLAAGSYLLNAGDGRSNKICTVHVSTNLTGNGVDTKGVLALDSDVNAIDMTRFGVIEGNFPNLGNLDLDDFVSTRTAPILAATTRQIVIDRPASLGVKPGQQKLTVRDSLTGQSATTNVVFYSASAKLTNVKVPSGAETHLVVTVLPKELEGEVSATILGGPVSFANGLGETTQPTSGGKADFLLQSNPGSAGKFDVSWQFSPSELIDLVWDPIKKVWEPVRRGLKSHVWDPLKKKIKELDWTPPKGGGAKKEDPPKVDEKKQEGPPKKGGDTKAEPPTWKPIKVVDGDGNVVGEGMEKTVTENGKTTTTRIFTEKRKTVNETVSVDGTTRTTDRTETTMPDSEGVTVEVTEHKVEKKDKDGNWVVDEHTKTTKKIRGGKIIDESTDVIKKPKKG